MHPRCSGSPGFPPLMCHKKGSATQYASERGDRDINWDRFITPRPGAQCDLLLWWHTATVLRSVTKDAGFFSADEPWRLHRCSGVGCGLPLRVTPFRSVPRWEGQEEHTLHSWSNRFPACLNCSPTQNPYEAIPAIVSDGLGGGCGGGTISFIGMGSLRGLKEPTNNAEGEKGPQYSLPTSLHNEGTVIHTSSKLMSS